MIRPPENLGGVGGRPKALPVGEDSPEIGDLSDDRPAAIGMDGGNLVEVTALLAESAEEESVEKPDLETELGDYAGADEIEEDVLLLLAGGGVLHGVPSVEEGDGSVVGADEVEAGVDGIGGGPGISVEVIGADLKIFAFVFA